MSVKHKFREPNGRYFVTYSVVDWADVFMLNAYIGMVVNEAQVPHKPGAN